MDAAMKVLNSYVYSSQLTQVARNKQIKSNGIRAPNPQIIYCHKNLTEIYSNPTKYCLLFQETVDFSMSPSSTLDSCRFIKQRGWRSQFRRYFRRRSPRVHRHYRS